MPRSPQRSNRSPILKFWCVGTLFVRLARLNFLSALAFVSIMTAAAAAAQDGSGLRAMGSAYWRLAAQADVKAAHEFISANHPAMLVQVRDPAFRDAEAGAFKVARARADRVDSYDGYTAMLSAYAVALKDAHIWSRATFGINRPEWAGVIMAKRAGRWIVAEEEVFGDAPSLVGAELISCDGVGVERFAEEKLGGFRIDWSIGAQQIHAAPLLLIDDHNPFVMRPKACEFSVAGGKRTAVMKWRLIKREALTPRIGAAIGAGAAGFGVRKAGAGYWISLQSLIESAAPVVTDVEARAAELRKAPFVVVDLRGNTGGSSIYGTRIAEALFGPGFVNAKVPSDDGCDQVWRLSEGNLAQLTYYRDVLGPSRGKEFTDAMAQLLSRSIDARRRGKETSGPVECPAASSQAATATPASLMSGRLIVITDSLCFSSCLVVTHDLVALGALQVGQTTDANTRYSEVREVEMPSGLSKFSTLQAFTPGIPIRYGPFTPVISYPGDMSDTPALESWVLAQIARSDATRP
ncbi:S41 family peptidase [Sphingomonas sp. UYP23]